MLPEVKSKETPDYLLAYKKPTLAPKKFKFFHRLFRITDSKKDNQLEIPQTLTAFSCIWSKLIKKEDILHQPIKVLGDDYKFTFVGDVRKVKLINNSLSETWPKDETHKVEFIPTHKPLAENYAHAEILLKHTITYNDKTKEPRVIVIEYEDWKKEFLNKGNMFYKTLRSDIREEYIKLFYFSSSMNNSCVINEYFINNLMRSLL